MRIYMLWAIRKGCESEGPELVYALDELTVDNNGGGAWFLEEAKKEAERNKFPMTKHRIITMKVPYDRIEAHVAQAPAEVEGTMDCQRCGSEVKDDRCQDQTCPFSDCDQTNPQGWAGHPEKTS